MKDSHHEKQTATSFISANSEQGFFSLYDTVFDKRRYERIFIITGGPGTGKSSLLRKIRADIAEHEVEIEEILCSSDPHSLDGLILTHGDRRVGILDGTPPHGRIPTSPAVIEEIWNLGAFWNGEQIRKEKEKILALTEKKSASYMRAYDLLHALGSVKKEERRALLPAFEMEKAKRQIRHKLQPLHLHGERRTRFLRSFSSAGEHLIPLEEDVQNLLLISGKESAAEIYLSLFADTIHDLKLSHTLFLSPLSPDFPDAIYIEENKTLLIKEGLAQKTLRGRRIIADRFFHNLPEQAKERQKLEQGLKASALAELKNAASAHKEIEAYYSSAMDFHALSLFTENALQEVLEALGITSGNSEC